MEKQESMIRSDVDGQLQIPNSVIIPFIEGDGTGPDIWRAARPVLEAALAKAYGDKLCIKWTEVLAGEKAYRETGKWLPQETLEQIRKYRVAIKGPLTTPVGEGIRSINVSLRQELDLYACVRPVKYIPGLPSPLRHPESVDMVVFRENTEDVYAGLEWQMGSPMAAKLIELVKQEDGKDIRSDSGIGLKPISRFGTARLVRKAIQYAVEHKRRNVTLVHKGNIMKFTEGAFRKWGYDIARQEFADSVVSEEELESRFEGTAPANKIIIKDRITDAMFQQILLRPDEYDVLAMPNLNGDYMSDALAAMAGGLGMAPGANIGDDYAVFEATHGTAPKYAGQDRINPGSLILSGAMMFDHMGWQGASEIVRQAVIQTIAQKKVTYDLARQMEGATEMKTSEFADAIIKNM
jgi:isocitrate dehydrogenase